MISSIIQALFIKIVPNMSEQEKKWQRIYGLLNAETKPPHKKDFRNNWSSFMASINPEFNTFDDAIWGVLGIYFWKQNKYNNLFKHWFA